MPGPARGSRRCSPSATAPAACAPDGGDVVEARIVVCDTTPRGLLALAQRRAPRRLRPPAARVPLRAVHREGRLGARRPRAVDGEPAAHRRDRPPRRHRGRDRRRARGLRGRAPARAPVPAVRAAVRRRSDPRARRQAHRVDLHPRPARRGLGAGARALHGAHRGAGRALRARLPRPDPRPPRHGPGDLQARNDNLEHGDVGGGSYELDQLVFRPVPSLSPYRTPLRGLYLGSASAFPGGAVHGIPGDAAARAALQDAKLRRV